MSDTLKDSRSDVVVVGGGPAGAACALTLAQHGASVVLFDNRPAERFRIGEGLPPAACPLLKTLGLWEQFLKDGHIPSHGNLSVWGSHEAHCRDFLNDPGGCGWHLDRSLFDLQLREAAAHVGTTVFEAAHVRKILPGKQLRWQVHIETADGTMLTECDWLVDATGRHCVVARSQTAQRILDDRLVCRFAQFTPTGAALPDHDGRTLIESTMDGWWYTALLPNHERVVAYLTDSDLLKQTSDDITSFVREAERTGFLHACLEAGQYRPSAKPRVIGAQSGRTLPTAGDGWIAVGDAAVSFDPLSSQGLMNALYTGMRGAEAILNHHIAGYQNVVDNIYDTYRLNFQDYYAMEQRWENRLFWQRRLGQNRSSAERDPDTASG